MWATFERFELQLTMRQAKACAHVGRCDEDVAELLKVPSVRRQLAAISDEALAAELRECGAWDDEELKSRADNEARVLWEAM